MDPITQLVVAGAVGGASGKLAEKAWDRTELWLGDFYRNPLEKALQRGRANAASFVLKFAAQAKVNYLIHVWESYRDLTCSPMDFLHLLTESCVVESTGTRASLALMVRQNFGVSFSDQELVDNSGTSRVWRLWANEHGRCLSQPLLLP